MLLIVACSRSFAEVIHQKKKSFAEVTAIGWALQLARDEKFQSITIKGDSKIYVDALNKNLEEASWEIQPLLYDASILAISFIDCCFCWIERDANFVAHELSMRILYSKYLILLLLFFGQNGYKRKN